MVSLWSEFLIHFTMCPFLLFIINHRCDQRTDFLLKSSQLAYNTHTIIGLLGEPTTLAASMIYVNEIWSSQSIKDSINIPKFQRYKLLSLQKRVNRKY